MSPTRRDAGASVVVSSSSAPARRGSPPRTSSPSAASAATILEADDVVGGISRTVERDGWRFDIGGHRFFTKVKRGRRPLVRDPRPGRVPPAARACRRILYRGKLYDYPLKPLNALRNLGPVEAVRCVVSYALGQGPPAGGHQQPRGLLRQPVRLAALRALLQPLQREGLGRPRPRRSSADFGRPAVKGMSLMTAMCDALDAEGRSRHAAARASRSRRSSSRSTTRSTAPGRCGRRRPRSSTAGGTEIVFDAKVVRIRHRDGARLRGRRADVDGSSARSRCTT